MLAFFRCWPLTGHAASAFLDKIDWNRGLFISITSSGTFNSEDVQQSKDIKLLFMEYDYRGGSFFQDRAKNGMPAEAMKSRIIARDSVAERFCECLYA